MLPQSSFNITKVLNVVALATLSMVTHASIYALNFMIFPDLAPDLDISGLEFGILAGVGLTVSFIPFLIPLGMYVDTWDKRTLILGGLLLKLFFGALQSIAWDFWSLLVIRIGLGLGFASSFAPCISIVSQLDYGSDIGIGLSYSVLATGPYLGIGLASWAAVLSYLYGWQTTFGLFGFVCGLEAFVIILLVPQDKGGERMWASEERLLAVWFTQSTHALLTAAGSFSTFSWLATAAYFPIYFQRFVVSDASAVPAISLWVGGVLLFAGCLSVPTGSLATQLLLQRTRIHGAPAFVAAAASLIAVPLLLLALFAPFATWLVLVLLFLAYFFSQAWIGPAVFMTQVRRTVIAGGFSP